MAHNKFLGHSQWFESRVVTKISRCWVNTTSRRGIKQLWVSFGYIFLLFCFKVAGGLINSSREGGGGETPAARASCLFVHFFAVTAWIWVENAEFQVLQRKCTSDDEISSQLFLNLDMVLRNSTLGGFTYV